MHDVKWRISMGFSSLIQVSLLLASFGEARVLPKDITADSEWVLLNQPWLLGLVGGGVLICGILIIFGCANLCEREQSFKDFENEDNCEVDTRQAAEFSMYPPVESTQEAMGSSPVIFEPLPDITKRGRVSNASVLRPKVSQAISVLERTDSEDSIEEALSRDSVQDKLKLQSLLSNSRNQLPRSQLQYIKELGAGYFGKVLQGEGQKILPGHKKTKVVIQMLKEEADPSEQLCFLQEAVPFREIEHQNLLKVFGQCIETLPYLVVLELCPFGDLKTYLRSHRVAMESFDEKGLLLKFACDMAAGLQALHQANYVHHDFAIRNCHLASDLTVKVGDYGLSEDVYKEDYYFDANHDPIPIRWMAPETLRYAADGSLMVKRVSKEANIWTYGVGLWEVIQFGALPYSDLSNEHVLRLVIKERSIKLPKPDLPLAHIDRLYQLMQLCWAEPRLRPSLRELRIMLLHLLSTKGNSDSSAFEQKWNQLMPRRPPTVQRVPDNSAANRGFESDFMQLDAARLADTPTAQNNASVSLHDELSQAMTYGTNIPSPTKELTTPSNELSLEAELSMAMGGSSPGGETDQVNQERGSPEGGRQSDEEEGRQKSNSLTAAGIEVTVEDTSTGKQAVPDIVATSTVQSNGRPDFMTSTPKPTQNGRKHSLGTGDGPDEDVLSSTLDSNSSYEFYPKHRRTSSGQVEEVSLFGQSKFAAMLQTVAAPSFDGEPDDFDNMSSASDSANKSTEDLFEQLEVGEGQGTKTLSEVAKSAGATTESEVILLEDTDPLSN